MCYYYWCILVKFNYSLYKNKIWSSKNCPEKKCGVSQLRYKQVSRLCHTCMHILLTLFKNGLNSVCYLDWRQSNRMWNLGSFKLCIFKCGINIFLATTLHNHYRIMCTVVDSKKKNFRRCVRDMQRGRGPTETAYVYHAISLYAW